MLPYSIAPVATDLTAPGPIGSVTPSTGAFTTLSATGAVTFNQNAATAPATAGGSVTQLIGTDASVARFEADSFGAIAAFTVRRANNTGASPTALVSNDQIGAFNFHGYYVTGGPAYSGVQASLQGFATQNWTSTANGTKVVISTTPNNSTTLTTVATFGQDASTTLAGALVYGGVTLSAAVTGTGNMVLSASPTFTGTPVLSTATATSLQVTNIGNVTPGAIAATTLSATTSGAFGAAASATGIITASPIAISANVTAICGTASIIAASADNTNDVATFIGYNNDSNGPNLNFLKTRATTTAATTIVQSGDLAGGLNFFVADGAAYRSAAKILVKVDGTPGSSDAPGRIEFYTTPDGSATPALALTIDNTKLATFGGALAAPDNLTFSSAAKGPVFKQGANGRVGTFVANGTTPVTVSNTAVAVSDAITVSLNTTGGTGPTIQPVVLTITAATGFTVAAAAGDTSTYNYTIQKNAA